MDTEIEAKLKVESLELVERSLSALGAEFLAEQLHRDYYFDDENSSFKNSDRALRLRQQIISGSEKNLLTYKGPKQKDDFKKRNEIEVEVTDRNLAEQLLFVLGYKRSLVFQKNRRLWQLGKCTVAMDQLPLLGSFVEIEGPDDKTIADVQKRLGLADCRHIVASYADLMEQKLRQLGKNEREVFF